MLRCGTGSSDGGKPVITRSILVALLMAGCNGESEEARREEVFRQYIEAVNASDVSAAVFYHTPNPEFLIPGQRPIIGTEAMRALHSRQVGSSGMTSGVLSAGSRSWNATGLERWISRWTQLENGMGEGVGGGTLDNTGPPARRP
jgi:hypothetical protein